MAITPIDLNTHGVQGREIGNANWLENQTAGSTVSIPIIFDPPHSPKSPDYALIKSDGTPDPTSEAIEFTGAGSVTIPHYAGLDFTTDFTVDCWAFLDAGGQNDFILTKIPSAGSAIFRIQQRASAIRIQTGSSTDVFATIGAWNHIVLTYNQSVSDLDVYIDSVFQTTISIAFASNTNDWTVGARFPVSMGAWTGKIDELKLVGAYYSQADVDTSYNSGLGLAGTPSTPNIINGYHWNDNLLDFSGNTNTATANGTTAFVTGKVSDPLGGANGIFGFVWPTGRVTEIPLTIDVPSGYTGNTCVITAKVYVIGSTTGDIDFQIYSNWTNITDEMLVPDEQNKSYALTPILQNRVLTTNSDPIQVVHVLPDAGGNGVIAVLFRRKGDTDTFNGDIAIMSFVAEFIYS